MHIKYRTKCLFICLLVLLFAGTAFAFGGGHSGSKSTSFKNGVDAIGIYFNGDGQADIDLVDEETDPYVQPTARRLKAMCPKARVCGAKCCAQGHTCQTGEGGEPMCCDEDGNCCPNSVAYDSDTNQCCAASAGSYTDSGCCAQGVESTTIDNVTVCCAEGEEAFCTKFENGECVAGACCATAEDGKTIRWSRDNIEPDVCETTLQCDVAHRPDENDECTLCAEGWHAIAAGPHHIRCLRPKGYHCPARCVRNTCSKIYYTLCDEEQCEELGDHFIYGENGCGCIEGYTGKQCNSCADRYYKDGNGNCVFDPDCAEPNTFTCLARTADGSCDGYACCPTNQQAYCYAWASDATSDSDDPDLIFCDDARCCEGAVIKGNRDDYESDQCVAACRKGGYSDGTVCCQDGRTSVYTEASPIYHYWGPYSAVAGSCQEKESTRWYIDDDGNKTYWFEYKRYYGEESNDHISTSYPYLSAGSWQVVYDPNDEEHPYTVYDYYRDDDGTLKTIEWYPESLDEVENTPVKTPNQLSLLEKLFGVKSALADGVRPGTDSPGWNIFKEFTRLCPNGVKPTIRGNMILGATRYCCQDGNLFDEIRQEYALEDPSRCGCPDGGDVTYLSDNDHFGKCCKNGYLRFKGAYSIQNPYICGCPNGVEPTVLESGAKRCCQDGNLWDDISQTYAFESQECCEAEGRVWAGDRCCTSEDDSPECCEAEGRVWAGDRCCTSEDDSPECCDDANNSEACCAAAGGSWSSSARQCCLTDDPAWSSVCCDALIRGKWSDTSDICCEDAATSEECCAAFDGAWIEDMNMCCTEEKIEEEEVCCKAAGRWIQYMNMCCTEEKIEEEEVCCKAAGREWVGYEHKCCPGKVYWDSHPRCCTSENDAPECCPEGREYADGDKKCCSENEVVFDGMCVMKCNTGGHYYCPERDLDGNCVVGYDCCYGDLELYVVPPALYYKDSAGDLCCPKGSPMYVTECVNPGVCYYDCCASNNVFRAQGPHMADLCCETGDVAGAGQCCNFQVDTEACCEAYDYIWVNGDCCTSDLRTCCEEAGREWSSATDTCCAEGDVTDDNGQCCNFATDTEACCEGQGRAWSSSEGRCCEKGHEDECCDDPGDSEACCAADNGRKWDSANEICCEQGTPTYSDGRDTYCCTSTDHQECCVAEGYLWATAIGQCCGENISTYEGQGGTYCCWSPGDSKKCCEEKGYRWSAAASECCVDVDTYRVDNRLYCCHSEDDNQACCKRSWANLEKRCCGEDEHVTNGHCCPEGYEYQNGRCSATQCKSYETRYCVAKAGNNCVGYDCCDTSGDKEVTEGVAENGVDLCCAASQKYRAHCDGGSCVWDCCEGPVSTGDGENGADLCCLKGQVIENGQCHYYTYNRSVLRQSCSGDSPGYASVDGRCCEADEELIEENCCPAGSTAFSPATGCCTANQTQHTIDGLLVCCDAGQTPTCTQHDSLGETCLLATCN